MLLPKFSQSQKPVPPPSPLLRSKTFCARLDPFLPLIINQKISCFSVFIIDKHASLLEAQP